MSPSLSTRLLLTQSDTRLLALARTGHERAFEALVQRYRRPLLRYCRRALLADERAEDALQQAFLQAWLALERGVEVRDVRAWLYRIVHNAALNTLRISGYDYCTLSDTLCGADAPQADLDRRIAVREALAGLAALPEMQREALLRTAVEGRSHEHVARDLGVSENALRGLVYRARATLRSAATAITPTPLLSWIANSANRDAPLVERLAEVGGGSAGMAGLLLKGGAVAMTLGALATGAGVSHAPSRATAIRPLNHEIATASPSRSRTIAAFTSVAGEGEPSAIGPSRQVTGHHAIGPRQLPSPAGEAQPDDSPTSPTIVHAQVQSSPPPYEQPRAGGRGDASTPDGPNRGQAASGPGGSSDRGDDGGGDTTNSGKSDAVQHNDGSTENSHQGESTKGGTGSSNNGSPNGGSSGEGAPQADSPGDDPQTYGSSSSGHSGESSSENSPDGKPSGKGSSTEATDDSSSDGSGKASPTTTPPIQAGSTSTLSADHN